MRKILDISSTNERVFVDINIRVLAIPVDVILREPDFESNYKNRTKIKIERILCYVINFSKKLHGHFYTCFNKTLPALNISLHSKCTYF